MTEPLPPSNPINHTYPTPASAPFIPSAFRPAGYKWVPPFRWFLAEFMVVVASILVALALSSSAEDLRDHQRERSYLHQFNVDLEANEKILVEAEAFLRLRAEASARILHRFWREDLTVDASTRTDLALPRSSRRFNPVLGTVNALMSTGDLNLVRDDALRTQLVTHLDSMKTIQDDIRRFDETYCQPGVHILSIGPDIHQFLDLQGSALEYTLRSRPSVI